MVAAAGSFAAVSTLFGSPIAGAFLLMEASGIGGPMLGVVLLPGLLASGVGALIFVGLDSLTGLGTFSLSVPGLPHFARPDIAEFGWALVIGVAAAIVGTAIHRLGLLLRPHVERRMLLLTPVVGMIIAGLAIAYTEGTGKSSSDVLFSGQSQLGPLITHAAAYSVGALLLLLACKGLAYGASLSSFRGGPTFPSLYHRRGGRHRAFAPARPAAGGGGGDGDRRDVRRHAPAAADVGAAGDLLLYSDGIAVMPLVIVAVVVAYVASARLSPGSRPGSGRGRRPGPAAATTTGGVRPRARPASPATGAGPGRGRHGAPAGPGGGPGRAAGSAPLAHRTGHRAQAGCRDKAVRPAAACATPARPGRTWSGWSWSRSPSRAWSSCRRSCSPRRSRRVRRRPGPVGAPGTIVALAAVVAAGRRWPGRSRRFRTGPRPG